MWRQEDWNWSQGLTLRTLPSTDGNWLEQIMYYKSQMSPCKTGSEALGESLIYSFVQGTSNMSKPFDFDKIISPEVQSTRYYPSSTTHLMASIVGCYHVTTFALKTVWWRPFLLRASSSNCRSQGILQLNCFKMKRFILEKKGISGEIGIFISGNEAHNRITVIKKFERPFGE